MKHHRFAVLLAVLMHPLSALAHGEGVLLTYLATIAVGAGALGGALSGLTRRLARVSWPLWFSAYLAIGATASTIAAGSLDGVGLFLTLGGLWGIGPFLLGFYPTRAIGTWIRRRIAQARQRRRRDLMP